MMSSCTLLNLVAQASSYVSVTTAHVVLSSGLSSRMCMGTLEQRRLGKMEFHLREVPILCIGVSWTSRSLTRQPVRHSHVRNLIGAMYGTYICLNTLHIKTATPEVQLLQQHMHHMGLFCINIEL